MMTLEKILEMWDKDSEIDTTNLYSESLSISKLKAKYLKEYTLSKLQLSKLDSELKELKRDKFEYYSYGPTEETKVKNWNQYPVGKKILKAEIPIYLDSDKDILNITMKISYYKELSEALSIIIKSLSDRNFEIKNAIEFKKFISGS